MILKNYKKSGYSLVEAVFYISILTLFFIIIINTIISFTKPYREILVLRYTERSGLDSMERMTRDIRGATSVNSGSSTLGSHPGVLTIVSTFGGISTTTRFYIDNGVLKVDVNGTYAGPLTSSKATVTNLVFRQMSNSRSSAVKVDVTISSSIGSTTRTKKYYSTTIIKGI